MAGWNVEGFEMLTFQAVKTALENKAKTLGIWARGKILLQSI